MSLDKILSYLKLSLWQAIVLGVGTALVLFDPFGWNSAGPGAFKIPATLLFGIASSNLFMIAVYEVRALLLRFWTQHKRKARMEQLTPDEKTILRSFIDDNTRVVQLPATSGVAARLVQADILYTMSGIRYMHSTNWHITDWAWLYLNKHKDLLTLSAEEEEQVDFSRIRGDPW